MPIEDNKNMRRPQPPAPASKEQNPATSTVDAPEQPKGNEVKVVTGDITVRSADRTPKDVKSLQNALIAAESPYYPNRTQLYDLYKRITLDTFLGGIINKRFDAVLNKTLSYKVNGEKVEALDKLIHTEEWRIMCREILDTKMWGISGLQFVPGAKFKFDKMPRKHIKPHWRRITKQQEGTEGWNYDEIWNIWVIGEPDNLGLLLLCGFLVLLKTGVISDWSEYIEMYGLPVTVLKYAGYDTQAKAEAKKIINDTGSTLRMSLPKEIDYEVKDGARSNSEGGLQNTFRRSANEELAVLILGNTETSTSSSKSGGRTQSETHSDQQKEIIKSDMIFLTNMLNSELFLSILKSYGFPIVEGGRFEFDEEISIEYIKQKSEIDLAWVEKGLPVSKDYIYRTYAIDKPKDGEELLEMPTQDTGADDWDDEDEDEPTPTKGKKKPVPKGKKPRNAVQKKLSYFQLMLKDFFAHAHD